MPEPAAAADEVLPAALADDWTRWVAMLPPSARSLARSVPNTAALAGAQRRGWKAKPLVDFVTRGDDQATPGFVASRLAIAAQRDPIKPPRKAEVVKPPRPRAPAMGACAGDGRNTTGCGRTTTVRTPSGRHCCPQCFP